MDQVAPTISGLFPTSTSVPDTTINNDTRHPTFRFNEPLDTLSVRFVQVGGGSVKDVVTQPLNASSLSLINQDITVTVVDTLISGERYSFQLFAKDLAGNVETTGPDTLKFNRQFINPMPDTIAIVASNNDSVIAGQNMVLNITVYDTAQTRIARAAGTITSSQFREAVTYGDSATVRIVADGQDLSGVTFSGTGVTNLAGTGTAGLSGGGWGLGKRTIRVMSTKPLTGFTVVVEDTTVANGSPDGRLANLVVQPAEFARYLVEAMDEGAATTTVQGPFQVRVVPTDRFGNPSTKTGLGTDSLGILTSRIASASVLNSIFVDLGTNLADAQVPIGPQRVRAAGDTFTVIAPNRTDSGLFITARTSGAPADSITGVTVATKHLAAVGSTPALSFVREGDVVTPTDTTAAPDTLIVQDWLGADGAGDQGGFVMATFPFSAQHAAVAQYRIYREVMVTTGRDSAGNVVVLTTPVQKMIPWAVVDAVPAVAGSDSLVQAVIPTLDNVATRWAVAAERGGSSSELEVAGKRVFSREAVQQMVQVLGIDPNRVMTYEELGKLFAPPQDYVKSILGDRKNLVLAALDPDVSSLLGNGSVPFGIRTADGQIASSAMTISEPARAIDNIAPAAVAGAEGTKTDNQVTLTWTPSVDDRIVAFAQYRGFSVPIAGVDRYEIWRGTTEDNLAMVATVAAGSGQYVDASLPTPLPTQFIYRVNALDLDNVTMGTSFIVPVDARRRVFATADGLPVYLIDLAGDLTENFPDFILFAQAFNKRKGEPGFNVQADINDDEIINFPDFIAFAQAFNRTAVGPATKPVVAPAVPGLNTDAEMSLSLQSDRVLPGQTVTVNVSLANAKAMQGYGLVLAYDTDKFEFVDAAEAEDGLLKSPLFLKQSEPGRVTIGNSLVGIQGVSGNGSVATLTFKVLREFEDDARFEIAEGIVFDPKALSNPAVVQGVLNVQSTPTEFTLLQNFPNPFNPETTIKYALAEAADVQLRIYNILGQSVRTLVAERQSAGRYQIRWNGTDDRGMTVSSGVYFYQIVAGKFKDGKRLMLLK
jgi:hypothetical protein